MFTHSNNQTPQSGVKFCCSKGKSYKRNMIKYLLYSTTILIHSVIAYTWCYFTGNMGMILMSIHWFLFNGCFISHLERWIHIKLIGETCYPDTWSTCFIKKQLNKWK